MYICLICKQANFCLIEKVLPRSCGL
uniref:Uncharacterized protein n=1 Tax=Anguilla anguilla TaxID=7936 RepID=A0A0E9SA18_ANGAN